MTEQQKHKLIKLKNQGVSTSQISKTLGIPYGTVWRHLDALNHANISDKCIAYDSLYIDGLVFKIYKEYIILQNHKSKIRIPKHKFERFILELKDTDMVYAKEFI